MLSIFLLIVLILTITFAFASEHFTTSPQNTNNSILTSPSTSTDNIIEPPSAIATVYPLPDRLITTPSLSGEITEESLFFLTCKRDRGYRYSEAPLFLGKDSPIAMMLYNGSNNDNLCGIEIGPSACNPFHLNTIHVGLTEVMHPDQWKFFRDLQIEECGDYAKPDVGLDAADLSLFATSTADFVIHSHVWEHLPNPLKALEEWVRVVKHSGTIYIIVPHPCASSLDCGRPVTKIEQMIDYYNQNATLLDFVETYERYQGHLHVFNQDLLFEIMVWFNRKYLNIQTHTSLTPTHFLIDDDKVENGYLIVWYVNKHDYRPLEKTYFGRPL